MIAIPNRNRHRAGLLVFRPGSSCRLRERREPKPEHPSFAGKLATPDANQGWNEPEFKTLKSVQEAGDFLRLKEFYDASILSLDEYTDLKDHFLKRI